MLTAGFWSISANKHRMDKKIEVFLIETPDPILGGVLGCDLLVTDAAATVADLLDALDEFAAARLSDCQGCDGCCQERAPILSTDIPALASLLRVSPWPAHAVVERFGSLQVKDGVSDIFLRREADGVCANLDRRSRTCRIWPKRPFVCRSHFCLPRSFILERLRQDIANLGLNELTRLLLAEEAAGAPPLGGSDLRHLLKAADYEENAFSGKSSYQQILLKDCVSPSLWRKLCGKRKGS